jgi:uncharacterized protein YjbJ (UPF0337 family)
LQKLDSTLIREIEHFFVSYNDARDSDPRCCKRSSIARGERLRSRAINCCGRTKRRESAAPFACPSYRIACTSIILTTAAFIARDFVLMKSSTKDKIKGGFKEAKGKVKEKAGKATGNPDLRDRGTVEKAGGKVERKIGDVKKVFEQ